jgi:hypothetical protein
MVWFRADQQMFAFETGSDRCRGFADGEGVNELYFVGLRLVESDPSRIEMDLIKNRHDAKSDTDGLPGTLPRFGVSN